MSTSLRTEHVYAMTRVRPIGRNPEPRKAGTWGKRRLAAPTNERTNDRRLIGATTTAVGIGREHERMGMY